MNRKITIIAATLLALGRKKDKYEHIGMKHVNTRTLGEKTFMYDLVREHKKARFFCVKIIDRELNECYHILLVKANQGGR